MKYLIASLCILTGCASEPVEKSTSGSNAGGHGGKVMGAVGGAGAGAAMGYSSAGMLCTISGPLCLVVVVPAAIVGSVVGLAAGSVVDAVSAAPRQEASPPAGTSSPPGG
ncbi:MAG TPA: hypothetical protein VF110_01325 [Burkholderiales bacterium]|jgi:hypothetical protein